MPGIAYIIRKRIKLGKRNVRPPVGLAMSEPSNVVKQGLAQASSNRLLNRNMRDAARHQRRIFANAKEAAAGLTVDPKIIKTLRFSVYEL